MPNETNAPAKVRLVMLRPGITSPKVEIGIGEYRRIFEAKNQPFEATDEEFDMLVGPYKEYFEVFVPGVSKIWEPEKLTAKAEEKK